VLGLIRLERVVVVVVKKVVKEYGNPHIVVRVDPEMRKHLKRLAKQQKTSLSALVRASLEVTHARG